VLSLNIENKPPWVMLPRPQHFPGKTGGEAASIFPRLNSRCRPQDGPSTAKRDIPQEIKSAETKLQQLKDENRKLEEAFAAIQNLYSEYLEKPELKEIMERFSSDF
jgi:hypothetical protein